MTAMWSGLSARERLLIIVATALIVVLVLVMVIIRPTLGMRGEARAAYEDAVQTSLLVNRAAAQPSQGEVDLSSLRTTITSTASSSGIIINRINSEAALIDLSINDADPAKLYAWLNRLKEQHNIVVRDAMLRPSTGGQTVTARLAVTRGES